MINEKAKQVYSARDEFNVIAPRLPYNLNPSYGSFDDMETPDEVYTAADVEKNNTTTTFDNDDDGLDTAGEVEPPAAMVYPDGGRQAWMTVVGAFCAQFCSFGWINTFGIFQTYYLTHQLEGYSPTAVSWISSLQSSIMFAGCLIVGQLFDSFGPRYLLFVGTIVQVLGIMMTSISTTYGPILVCHGIIAPLGAACVFNVAVGSVSSWFKQRRALALGIMSSGSSVGGIIYPFLIRHLSVETTFGWLMRACGFLILGLLIVANLTITSNVKPRGHLIPLYPRDLWRQFKDVNFTLIAIAFSLGFVGFTLPFTYIVSSAEFHGVDSGLATYLVSMLNGASILGRIIPAALADRVGQYNMNSIGIFLAGAVTVAVWIPARNTAGNIAYAVLYGFFSGTFVALIPACTAKISQIHEIGMRVGLMFACLALANLAGVPIGGAILGDATVESRWMGMMAFAGAFLILGGLVNWIARVKLVGPSLTAVC
ncbi:major facilitator superfamily domain-containing protein [Limtongia smithiae]|uniref:major facilitator superfamily domain-containing protein n=1 Tax=Limtongia smithiae TaxID=1125753 RepID=UPI0034CDD4D5